MTDRSGAVRWWRTARGRLGALAWLGTLAGAAALALAFAWPDDLGDASGIDLRVRTAAFMARVFAFHIGLGLAGVAAFALAVRARRCAAFAGALALAAAGPGVVSSIAAGVRGQPEGRVPADGGAGTITVLSANLLYSRADPRAVLREIERVRPDVILFQEYMPEARAALRPALEGTHPHVLEAMRDDAFGQAVFSRMPFAAPGRLYPRAGSWREPLSRVEIEVAGRRVVVMNVHAPPPVDAVMVADQRRQVRQLAEALSLEDPGSVVIVAGDFNATPGTAHLRAMARAGMRSAHGEGGVGRGSTWPRTGSLRFAPGIRLDHVLVRGPAEVVWSRVGPDVGSDHAPVSAGLRVR